VSSARLRKLALLKQSVENGWMIYAESRRALVKFEERLKEMEKLIEKEEADINAALAGGADIDSGESDQ
jgi:predicted component of type VI protein secretion system